MMPDANQLHRPGDGSTGPKTPAGKERSSQNAFVHGGRSEKHFILPNESEADFELVRARWNGEYKPARELEAVLLERIAQRDWAFQRWQRLYDEAEFNLLLAKPDPATWTDRDHRHLQLMLRYRTAAERAYRSALKDVEAYRMNRVNEALLVEKLKHTYYLNYKNGVRDKKPRPKDPASPFPSPPLHREPKAEEEPKCQA